VWIWSLSCGLLGGEIKEITMLKMAAAGATALCAGILCTTPYSLSVTPQGSVSLSLDSAVARIGHPLTPMSVAGVHRRAMRRTYGVGANLGYHPVARAALYGAAATGAGYYGAGYGWGGYGYGTGYGDRSSPDRATQGQRLVNCLVRISTSSMSTSHTLRTVIFPGR